MNNLQRYTPFFASALLMCAVLYFIYPHYQYYVDPDGTAYLTIAQRYADGDYQKAINGYWSPWSCWLTALLIKGNLSAIPASVVVNAAGAVGFLFISQSFFLRFNIIRKLQWYFSIALSLFLCYAVFWQSFDDLWECFFLLAALRLMLSDGFKSKFFIWIAYGIIGALAYFAKAYSLPFFMLNTLVCSYFISREQWLKISGCAIAVMLLCSLPWLIALHGKYGTWTTSTAGTLNTSWYLIGHPHWKQGIDLLIPPVYNDSPYFWEDPWFANGDTSHFWNSLSLLGLQLLRIGYNAWKLLLSMLQLSIFFPFIAIVVLLSLVSKKFSALFTGEIKIIVLSFLLFPLGYLLVNFEPRYIWYMVPLCMVLGGLLIRSIKSTSLRNLLIVILPFTFLIGPAFGMKKMFDAGEADYKIAQQLKQLDIHGSFASNAKPGHDIQRIERIAYFSGNSLYSLSTPNASQQDILKEMRRYHVTYYFALQPSDDWAFVDARGNAFPEFKKDSVTGLKIFRIDP